jgi:apolipoprotein N-acyltransferase
MDFFNERWYLLPVISGVVFVAAFLFPALSFFAWVAFVPLFYSIAKFSRTRWVSFWTGALTGGVIIFSLYYLTLFQFHWVPGQERMVILVQLGIIPAVLVGAMTLGLSICAYSLLRSKLLVLNALLGAACYMALESIFNAAFQGYYDGMLAHVAPTPHFLMQYSALGGVFLVSYIIAALQCAVAEILAQWPVRLRQWGGVAVVCLVVAVVGACNSFYLSAKTSAPHAFLVAVLQPGDPTNVVFGSDIGKEFPSSSYPAADLVLYPLSLVNGVLKQGDTPNGLDLLSHNNSTVVTWDSYQVGQKTFSSFDFWKNGSLAAQYQKQALHLFDYEYSAGPSRPAPVVVNGTPVGSLACSELVRNEVASSQVKGAQILLSMGSELAFLDSTLGDFSVKAAQYRAVEYNIAVVRADGQGPSALIASDGTIENFLPWGIEGTLTGSLMIRTPRTTLYSLFGEAPAYVVCGAVLLLVFALRRKEIFNR